MRVLTSMVLLLLLLLLSLLIGETAGAWNMHNGNGISVAIKVVDSTGNPIPFVTVWRYSNPSQPNPRFAWRQLEMDDLWQATLRHRDSFELAHRFSRPLAGIGSFAMTNTEGIARDVIDWRELKLSARPANTDIGYTFMRRGFTPEKRLLHADSSTSHLELTITLLPIEKYTIANEPKYLVTYDRVRFELMDWHRDEDMSTSNLQRIEHLRSELMNAANDAERSGDRRNAALMHARMETMPEIEVVDGKIIGFSETKPTSARNRTAIHRAIDLDKENGYFIVRGFMEQKRALRETFAQPPSEFDRQRLADLVREEVTVFAQYGDSAWADDRRSLFYDYIDLREYQAAHDELVKLRAARPRGVDYPEMLDFLKANMGWQRKPVPSTWQ